MALQTSMTVIDKMLQDKMDDLENHVDTLLKQKGIIESIETYSDRLDFGDLLETYKLLVEEIDRTQQELQRMKNVYSLPLSGENECVEEEEEEVSSFSSKYNIEHVIRDEDGKLRRVKPEDFDIEKHKGVRDAFKVIYEWQRLRQYEEDEEDEEEGSPSSLDEFQMENEVCFLELLRRHVRDRGLEWDRKR